MVPRTITFEANGGTFPGDSTAAEAKTDAEGLAVFPENPTRTGYEFDGWYTAADGGDPVTAAQSFTEDTTLYAHWTEVFTVTFDHNDGTGTTSTAQTPGGGGTVTFPADPTRPGYVFDGWYTAACGGDPVTASQTFTANTTLYAHWIELFTVTFDYNDGTGSTSTAQLPAGGGTVTFPANPTRPGYEFDGWYTAASGGTRVSASQTFTANTTLYAHWYVPAPPPVAYTVTFHMNLPDGTDSTSTAQTPDGGGTVTFPEVPALDTYTFDGWYTAATGGTQVTENQTFTADTALYAHWKGWYLNDEGTLVIVGTGTMEELFSDDPTASDGMPPWYGIGGDVTSVEIKEGITSIARNAFSQCKQLTSVTIPNTVTSIGESAFSSCTSLETIEIPSSVTSIDDSAFDGCTSLTNIAMEPNGNYSTVGGVLYNQDATTLLRCPVGLSGNSFAIPDTVTSIGDSAFADCAGLTSVTIPSSVIGIGSYAFARSGLTSVTIPSSVTSIGSHAFSGCKGLTSVTIPSSVTSIGSYAFSGSGLTSAEIPDTVTSMAGDVFLGCESLTKATIGNGVTSIADDTFFNCEKMSSVTIGAKVTSIGECAFYRCLVLKSITLPDTVTSIGEEAFYGCGFTSNVTIPDSVESIGNSAFAYCNDVPSITIGNKVKSIGDLAFSCCLTLDNVVIPSSVTSIGREAFDRCERLTTIYIPDSVESIGSSPFYGCDKLTTINFGGSEEAWKALNVYKPDSVTVNYSVPQPTP